MLDIMETTKIQQGVRAAIESAVPGAVYQTGYHGPDHTGRLVHDLTFRYGGEHFMVTVKSVDLEFQEDQSCTAANS